MWMAFVETDLGEVIRVICPDGLTGGKALLSFLTIAESGCRKCNSAEEDVAAWIDDFNENAEIDFCDAVEKLNHVYYPGSGMSEADFIRAIKDIREMWIDIQGLIKDVKVLVDEFKKGYLKETDWYVEPDTMGEFEGLLNTLLLAQNRNAKEVRIRIE